MAATEAALARFDADGEPIVIGGEKWSAKVPEAKYYQTPYGEAHVVRHVYQCSAGGKVFCPLEQGARILRNATPRFAKMVAHKLAQELSMFVCAVVQAKGEAWHYATPPMEEDIAAVGVSIDGSCS